MNIEQRKKEILDAHMFRHAAKAFDPDRKISDDDFRFILEVGRLAPSSVGFEPWQFLILQNMDVRNQIREVSFGAKGQMPTASHVVVILSRKDVRYDSPYVEYIYKKIKKVPDDVFAGIPSAYKDFQENDFHILDNERTKNDWAAKQTYIAMANMMTAAAEIGIDSCPMEGFNKDKVHQILTKAGLLDDTTFDISVMVAFGYRVNDPEFPKARRPLEDIIRWAE